MTAPPPIPRDATLWHVQRHGRETHLAGKNYWWDNATRPSRDITVAQIATAGHILLRTPEGDQHVPPGTLMLFRHGDDLSYGQPQPLTEPYVCRWVGLSGAGLAEHFQAITQRHGPLHTLGADHPLADQLDQLIISANPARAGQPTQLAAAIHRFVMDIHHLVEDRMLENLSPVEQALEAVLRHPLQPASLKEIAHRFGVSREHLSRVFKQRVGRPAQDYLAQAKQDHALALLRETRLPLRDVARQAGYVNAHSFARHVRQATGQSPSAYRQQFITAPRSQR